MAPSRNVVILAGGISHERDVSLRSGRRVADALLALGHRVTLRDPDKTLLAFLDESDADLIWPVLHGASGEDGALRALLATRPVPFIGSGPEGSLLAWNKPAAKAIAQMAGQLTPASITLPRESFRELGPDQVFRQVVSALPGDVVVKPAMGGSAQGVTIVEEPSALPRAVVQAYTYGETVLIERRVRGTEISVSIVDLGDGPIALPVVEIVPLSGVYSYHARYSAGETRFFAPARLDDLVARHAQEVALEIHALLGLRHLSRVDFIVDDQGNPWFLEVNVMPGLTETSIFPQAVNAAGLGLGDVYERIGEVALRESTQPS